MADLSLSCTHYALLIGIDAYVERPLRGCVRDISGIKKHLDDIPKPNVVHTQALVASLVEGETPSPPVEEPKSLPTHRNVVDAFENIACQAKDGDFVYIHFSGHGTAFRPPRESSPSSRFSNRSTGDLALVLLQDDGCKTQYLRGSELAYLLRDMVEKKLVVTLVLDCCFSGSFMRNDNSARYLDYDPHIDAAFPPMSGRSLGLGDEARRSVYRNASLRPNWLVNPDGYTVLTACGPTEIAREIQVDERVHGALSYFLIKIFDRLGGIGGKQQYIYQSLRAKFWDTRGKHRHNQNPMFYGNKSLYFFGRANPRIGPAPIPVTENQDNVYHLNAGQAHGICKGDKFDVCALSMSSVTKSNTISQGNLVAAEVISLGALTSELKLLDTTPTKGMELFATTVTRLSLQKISIGLDPSVPRLDCWTENMRAQQSLSISKTFDADHESHFSFVVSRRDNEFYEIRDALNCKLLDVHATSVGLEENIAHILDILEHLAHFEMVKNLKNQFTEDSQHKFQQSFRIQLVNPAGDRINPGCLRAGKFQPACAHAKCLVEVEENTSLELEVINKEEEGGRPICLHVYTMSSSWEIENVLRGDYEVIPPRSSNQSQDFRKGSSGIWSTLR